MDNQRKIKGLDGVEKTYTFSPLVRRDAAWIQYESAGLISTLISKLTEKDGGAERLLKTFSSAGSGSLGVDDVFAFADLARTIYETVPFEKLWATASLVLRGAIIQGESMTVRVEDLDECDYFNGKLDEVILATVKGIGVSFPLLGKKAAGLFKDSAAAAAEKPTPSKDANG